MLPFPTPTRSEQPYSTGAWLTWIDSSPDLFRVERIEDSRGVLWFVVEPPLRATRDQVREAIAVVQSFLARDRSHVVPPHVPHAGAARAPLHQLAIASVESP